MYERAGGPAGSGDQSQAVSLQLSHLQEESKADCGRRYGINRIGQMRDAFRSTANWRPAGGDDPVISRAATPVGRA